MSSQWTCEKCGEVNDWNGRLGRWEMQCPCPPLTEEEIAEQKLREEEIRKRGGGRFPFLSEPPPLMEMLEQIGATPAESVANRPHVKKWYQEFFKNPPKK